MSILIKGIPLGGYEISIMKDGERYRARVDGIWCEVEEIPTTDTDSDTISRQAAIEALRDYLVGKNVPCDGTLTCRLIENEVINKLPTAQPETTRRIVGKSKGGMTLWYECEQCREPVDAGDRFCRSCGRRFIKNHG